MFDVFTQIVFTIGKVSDKGIEMLGTGFLASDGKHIVTPRHVIGDENDNLAIIIPSISSLNQYQDTTINQCSWAGVTIKHTDPFRDLTVLEFKDSQPTFKHSIPLGSTDDISVGDEVYIFGFPHCTEGRRVLTFQKAMVGAKVLINSSGIKSKYCVINTQTRPGQSGSVIYSKTQNKIIAVLTGAFASGSYISLGGINPNELHQTTQCISAEYIKSMIGE